MGRRHSCNHIQGFAILGAIAIGGPAVAQNPDQAVILQSLLAEKGCYRSEIDGLWGPRSRGALALILEAQTGVAKTVAELGPTASNIAAVRESGLRCIARAQDTPERAGSPRATRSGATPTVRSMTIDCPGPGCPLGPSDVQGTGWGREVN